jgi:hypothetical protein
MITIRALLIVAVATFAVVVDGRITASAQTSRSAGPQSTYTLAAGRDDDDGPRGARNSPPVVKPDDDDDKPRIRTASR